LWDYWLNEAHGECDGACESPLHEIYAAYMDKPSREGGLTGVEKALAHLFELRVALDFSLNDVINLTTGTSDEDHYLAKSGLQYMTLEFHKFNKIYDYLMGQLGESQRASMSHLMPICERVRELSEGMPDLRDDVVHPGSGLFGIVSRLDHGSQAPGQVPENSFLVCANLVNAFIDGLMHSMPGEFCSSLSKLPPNAASMRLYDFRKFPDQVADYNRKNPVRCVALDRMGGGGVPIASELIRLRWALRGTVEVYRHTNSLQTVAHGMPKLWVELERQRLLLYVRHMVIELYILLDLCDKMREGGLDPPKDAVIRELCDHRGEITRLRTLAVKWDAVGEYSPFPVEIERGIGHGRLLLLASAAAEWVRINANHYQEKCDGDAQIPDLPDMVRRLDFVEAEREAALYRVRARNGLDRMRAVPVAA